MRLTGVHRAADAERARLVARRHHDPGGHDERPSAQARLVALFDGGEEAVSISMENRHEHMFAWLAAERGRVASGAMSRVYVSLPLRGPTGAAGREVLRGVELAATGLELVVLEASGEDRDALTAEHARRAAEDPEALAFIGGFHSSQALAAAPALGEAGLVQIAPAATYSGLHGETLVRLMPDDGALARAIAHWLDRNGVQRLLIVHDHDDGYGVPVARMCADATAAEVRSRPVWDWDEDMADDVSASAGRALRRRRRVRSRRALGRAARLDAALWLLGTDGVAHPRLARELSAGAAARTRFFSTRHAPWGFYGYEAMALARDAIAAGGDRAGVVRALRSTRDRDSVLGRYSLDEHGHTTSTAYAALEVADGEIVWGFVPAAERRT